MRRIFYVSYVKGEVLGDCLNAICFLARPTEKCHAHITVRGPYKRRIKAETIKNLNSKMQNICITIDGVGNFFDTGQNTVFLSCTAPGLKDVWNKPDFPNIFNPHVTLYDGSLGEFAKELYTVVSQYNYNISYQDGKIESFVSISGQSSFALQLKFNELHISKIVGWCISSKDAAKASNSYRLKVIDRICKYLSWLSEVRSTNLQSLSWDDLSCRP